MNESYISHTEIKKFAEEKVNLKQEDVKEYRDQIKNLRTHLQTFIQEHPDYGFVKTLHSGSVRKGTALKTINDMDLALYIRESELEQGDDLKEWLIKRLQAAYPNKSPDDFIPKQHCVAILFKGSGLDVDVVPIIYEDDPDDKGYLIVKDTGERVLTSIKLHLEFIRSRKDAQPTHFAQIIRLMKWWKRQCRKIDDTFRFKSFMIELTCAKLADDGLDMSDYPFALEQIFTYILKSQLQDRIYFLDYYSLSDLPSESSSPIEIFDPVNPGNNAASTYTEFDRKRIIEFSIDTLDAITEARYATNKERAIDLWKEVFGASFSID